MDFIVEVSARHVHLTQEHVEALFGKGHELTFDRPLSQPGQFLSKEKVTIKNGDRKIERVSILGPVRKASQVEVSKTDSVALRAEGFIRESGDLAGTAPVEIEGPEGSIQLSEGLIIAKRHIHMTPENAAEAGLKIHLQTSSFKNRLNVNCRMPLLRVLTPLLTFDHKKHPPLGIARARGP